MGNAVSTKQSKESAHKSGSPSEKNRPAQSRSPSKRNGSAQSRSPSERNGSAQSRNLSKRNGSAKSIGPSENVPVESRKSIVPPKDVDSFPSKSAEQLMKEVIA